MKTRKNPLDGLDGSCAFREWHTSNWDWDTAIEWQALKTLLERLWFRRIWIIQEVAVAKHAVVHCRHIHMSWNTLQQGIHYPMIQGYLAGLPPEDY
jgi:hypothetical protein